MQLVTGFQQWNCKHEDERYKDVVHNQCMHLKQSNLCHSSSLSHLIEHLIYYLNSLPYLYICVCIKYIKQNVNHTTYWVGQRT